MTLIKKLPVLELQEAVYGLLEAGQTAQVYRDVPIEAVSPYITIGLCTVKPLDTKNNMLWNCSVAIDIWSTGAGTGEIIEMDEGIATEERHIPEQARKVFEAVNDINYLISKYGQNITVDGYKVLDAEVEQSETYPTSDFGYHATISVRYQLTDK